MKASDLEYRIDIYKQVRTRSASGAITISYVFKGTCRARVNYTSGSRTITNDEIFYNVDRTFIVRHYVDVVDTDIIHWNNQKWQILSIDHNKEFNNIVIQTTLINE